MADHPDIPALVAYLKARCTCAYNPKRCEPCKLTAALSRLSREVVNWREAGADAQHALNVVERERDEARAALARYEADDQRIRKGMPSGSGPW